MRIKNLGWVVAAGVLAMGIAAGFQGTTSKIGIVDIQKVFADSDYYKSQSDALKAIGLARQAALEFVDNYRTFTVDQANRFKDLSIKPNLTAPEKAELEKIKSDVMASSKRLQDLQQKSTPAAAESAELQELSQRVQRTSDSAQRWSREFSDEFQQLQDKYRRDALDKVRAAVRQVSKDQGYTVVFVTDVAPYGANDVTAEALKVMNKK